MTATAKPAEAPVESVRTVVGVLVLFEIVSGFLQAGIQPVLPGIGDHLGVSDGALTWVVSVQLLAAAICVPMMGRLGDLYGHRLLLRIALLSMAVGSVLVALAPNFPVLLAGRALQGTVAVLLPLEIALVRDRLPVELARRAIARLVGALTLGGLLGAIGMGILDSALGDVRLALAVPAVLAVLCVPVSLLVPESKRRAPGRMDWPGAVLLSVAMVALLAGVSAGADGWLRAATLVPVTAGAAVLALWALVELRAKEPLVDLRAMAGRNVAPFYFTSFAFGVLYFGSQSPNSTFLAADRDEAGYGFGLSALQIGLTMLPALVASIIGSASTARIAAKLGYRPALLGSFLLAGGASIAVALLHDQLWTLMVAMTFAGFGMGVALGAMPTVIAEATDPDRTGIATALYNNVKTFGGALAGGVFGTLLTEVAGGDHARESGYVAVWLVSGTCALIAAALVLVARRQETAED